MWLVCMVAFCIATKADAFFEKQPKLISEMGNLVIESALDANITFRMRGRGVLLINDLNVMPLLGGNVSQPMSSSVIEQLRSEIAVIRATASLVTSGYRTMATRVRNLENGTMGTLLPNPRRAIQRRLSRLETRLEEITTMLETDHCTSNPCENGGTCTSSITSFNCRCPDNWEGTRCTEDVNECANFAGSDLGCQNGATCLNSRGSYSCMCAPNWKGIHCNRRTVDCLSSPAAELCGHGTCVQTNDAIGFSCICEQGWKTNDVTVACTVDVDECADSKPHCSMEPEVRCINLPGTYMCGWCPTGYTGNGHYCSDVNECETNNGGCSTNPTVQCVNTRGSSHCGICPAGYEGDGRTCNRVQTPEVIPRPGDQVTTGACSVPGFCHSLARCVIGVFGMASCVCPQGYIGSGFGQNGCRASTIDPCFFKTCLNGGTCVANGTIATCQCREGFDPPLCFRSRSRSACDSHPCQNGGTCTSLFGDLFMCRCPPTHTGDTCTTATSSCGGVLSSASGILKHPISDKYAHDSRCAWLIVTNSSQVLNITFTRFNLEASNECRFDWLQIHDGRSSSAYPIGRFCGGSLPKGGNIISTHNALYLWFRSDNTTSSDGFELSWEAIPPVCGGEFVLTGHGTLKSPGAPGNYPQNRDCEWNLSALPGKRIQLTFFTMQLETHDACDYDFLAIYDGSSTSESLLVRFCNTSHPEPLTSTMNELTLHFHSDDIGTDAGFQIHYSVVEGIPGCGGTWTTRYGEISSPQQDGRYPRDLRCEYVIRMPSESRVKVTFISFNMEMSSDCYSDYLQIFDGSSTRDPDVGKFCGNRLPDPYVSRSNVLTLLLKTDWSVSGEGFRLIYEQECGGRYTDSQGIITSPMYPKAYDMSVTCVYEIIAPPGKAIVIDFVDFDLEDSAPDCIFDVLKIFEGHRTNQSVAKASFCGEERPPQIITAMNLVTMSLITDHSVQGRGFKANYTLIDAACGGVVKELGHPIQPPIDGDSYKTNANCTWIIVAPPNHIVQLSFDSFDLEMGSQCYFDYVDVFDGVSNGRSHIGKYCGNRIPPIIHSTTDALTVEFKSDGSLQGDGFSGKYSFLDARDYCGGRFFSLSGTVHSPGWPSDYPNSRNCTWIIIAEHGKQVELTVQSFDLENQYWCNNRYDFLEIRNGDSLDSPLIGRFCSNDIPKTFRSLTNKILIFFKSDSSIRAGGFAIDWQSSLTGCGGTIRDASEGSITSPNYPQEYDDQHFCEWRISVSQGSLVKLVFTDMDIEELSNCRFDSLSVYDGRNAGSPLLGRFCGTQIPPQINSTTNDIFLRMVSDMSNQGRGFSLQFNAVCSHTINNLRGVIQSPNNPHDYPHNSRCEWTIVAPKGNKIQLTFTQFEMEYYDNSCQFDFLEIMQLDSSNTVLEQKKYCETGVLPPQFLSFSEVVKIKFKTDSSGSAAGFRLEYNVFGCGGLMNRPEGKIISPNYPTAYDPNQHCHWDIELPFGSLLELTIYDYDIQQTVNCTANGLWVSNVKNDTDLSAKRYCGRMPTDKPVVITSSSNKLYIKLYSSDGSFSGRGFNASYRAVPITCGGIFKNTKGVISSPNYPSNYDPNMSCEWLIETQESHILLLNFLDFSLEKYSDECEHDFVVIYDGTKQISERQLGKLCGNNISPNTTFASTDNTMLVVMKTDFSHELKGFLAHFVTACGANLVVKNSGIINARNMGEWNTPYCNWTFTAENTDQHIQLIFLDVHMTSDCKSIIEVNTGGPSNTTICNTRSHMPPMISAGQQLSLHVFPAPGSTSASFRFEAMYTLFENGCGNVFNAKYGSIASPLYPKTYPLNMECEWQIKASPGNKLLVTFTMLDIDTSEHCNEDYLELRNSNAIGKLIGVYCGPNTPADVQIEPGNVWMKFFSDNDGVGQGFFLEYSYAREVEISGTSGIISSPLYPKFDLEDTDRTYRITVGRGQLVSVVIGELVVRSGSRLTIYDGYDDQSETIGSYSMSPVETIYSSTNVILIKWDVEIEGLFKLNWNEVGSAAAFNSSAVSIESLNCTANSLVHLGVGRVLNISSPGYPFGYDNSLACQWTIVPDQMGFHPVLYFETVDLESVSECISDFVSVSSGSNMENFVNLATLCTTTTNVSVQNTYVGSPLLRLNFVSDSYVNRTGFNAIVRLGCGGAFTSSSGVITKNMTLTDLPGTTCSWSITVREGHTIEITFTSLNLRKESTDGMCDSFLLLRNGHFKQSPFLGNGQYCGTDTPSALQTVGHQAFVQFVTGNRSLYDNFAISFQEVSSQCGENIILPDYGNASTIIQSPNYPNIPNAFSECIWTITAPHGELLRIDFIDQFDLFISTPCEQEFVELRDGAIADSPLIGSFCNQIPSSQRTTSNVLRVRYMTQQSVPKNGFRARVSVSNCGGHYRSNTGIITSPNYPGVGAYPTHSVCDYHIFTKVGSSVNITFLNLDLPYDYYTEEGNNCSGVDHVELYNVYPNQDADNNTNGTELSTIGAYCGNNLPASIITEGFEILVRFISFGVNEHYTGFRISFNASMEKCGGDINSAAGVVSSPGYPIGRSIRQFCEWRITVPKGRRVRVDLMDFDFLSYGGTALRAMARTLSFSQRLTFYNDFAYGSRVSMLTGTDTPKPIYSSDNMMLINMWMRSNAGHRGFKLNFTSLEPTICVGDFNELQGSIQTPINDSFACHYQREGARPFFVGPSGAGFGTMALRIVVVELSRALLTCTPGINFPIRIINRETTFVKRKCLNGTENIFEYATPFTNTQVQIRSHIYIQSSRIEYKLHPCGEIIKDVTDYAIIPVAMDANYGAVHCVWHFSAKIGVKIKVSMNFSQLNCEKEYINIFNGGTRDHPMIERVCGIDAGTRNFSTEISGPKVLIEYHSEQYNLATRFFIHIDASYDFCGGQLVAPYFRFTSPVNGTNYPNNVECIWEIRARPGYHIGISFVDRFFVEQSINCTKDYVALYDKSNDNYYTPIGQLCGRSTVKTFNSSAGEMKVLFRTDSQVTGDGFTAIWSENCGGTFAATKTLRTIVSPNYPENYPPNSMCNYTITAPTDSFININFDDFEIEQTSRGCIYDNLTIYKQEDWTFNMILVGSYCGKETLKTLRYKNTVQLIFRSDGYLDKRGFRLHYSLDNCGGDIHANTQVRVPINPETSNYLEELRCIWNITAPDEQHIVVRFETIDLEQNDYCYQDFVEVYEGHQTDLENRKAHLCGNLTSHTPIVNINANKAILRFQSDSSIARGGFSALILMMPKCDRNIELTDKAATYHLDETSTGYGDMLDCHYKVFGPDGWVVKIEFTEFHVALCAPVGNVTSQCGCDFVEVRDGGGPYAEKMGENRCGHSLPQSLTSTHPSLWVRFATDTGIQSTGFKATFSLQRSACGPRRIELNTTSVTQYTLNWPRTAGKYLPNERCTWEFSAPDSYQLAISVDRLDTQPNGPQETVGCSHDYIEIMDSTTNPYVVEGLGTETIFTGVKTSQIKPSFYTNTYFASAPHLFCGNGKPEEFYTSNSKVLINFRSDESDERTGFAITAKLLKACHRNFTSLQGRIMSNTLETCETDITVPANYTIALFFGRFFVYPTVYPFVCSDTNKPLTIFDGNQLATGICAQSIPPPYFSNTSHVTLKFNKIDITTWGGSVYDITYVATDKGRGCGGNLFNYGGQFSSPLYPSAERSYEDCRWTIEVPQNLVVSLKFEVFDMGTRNLCASNFVQFLEMIDGQEEVKRTFCGDDNPAIYVGTSHRLVVRFKKTVNFAGTGWLINFMAVQPNALPTEY